MGEITRLLEDARQGDAAAWDQVVALLYDELLVLARRVRGGRHAGHTMRPTALVNECYLRVARRQADAISDREHFLAVAARAMRQILVNHARKHFAVKRGGDVLHVTLHEERLRVVREAEDLIAMDKALEQLEREDPRLVKVVDCRVFGGLSEAETAQAMDMSLRSAQRLWHRARQRMRDLLADDMP